MNMAMHNQGCCSRCKFECIDRWMHGYMNEKGVIKKTPKGWLEVTFDLMGWPKWVQNANYVNKRTIFFNTTVAHKADFKAQ